MTHKGNALKESFASNCVLMTGICVFKHKMHKMSYNELNKACFSKACLMWYLKQIKL